MENGSLSLEAYLDKVKVRLEKDRLLAVYCNQKGEKQSAVRVMKRIRIMQTEIDSVNSGIIDS